MAKCAPKAYPIKQLQNSTTYHLYEAEKKGLSKKRDFPLPGILNTFICISVQIFLKNGLLLDLGG